MGHHHDFGCLFRAQNASTNWIPCKSEETSGAERQSVSVRSQGSGGFPVSICHGPQQLDRCDCFGEEVAHDTAAALRYTQDALKRVHACTCICIFTLRIFCKSLCKKQSSRAPALGYSFSSHPSLHLLFSALRAENESGAERLPSKTLSIFSVAECPFVQMMAYFGWILECVFAAYVTSLWWQVSTESPFSASS